MKMFLFDIDGTLIRTRGVGQRAADKAFEIIYGISNIMDGIDTCGRTDPVILGEMFRKAFSRSYYENESQEFFGEYLLQLETELKNEKEPIVLPGVTELLDDLHERPDTVLAVGTGNIEGGAWLKLKYAGLKKYFTFGGFGSDSENREGLLKIAIIKGRIKYNGNSDFEKVFVIGDTPMDIIHGTKTGAETIAVATGLFTKTELKKHNPHHLLDDLNNSYIANLT